MLRGGWRRLERDMVAFSTAPPLGLNGTGWLLLHPEGNIAFEAAPFYTDDMLAEIRRLGGIRFLAASHVHGYGALWQLQDAFGPEVMAIQKEDLRLTKAFRVTWPYDDALELPPRPHAAPCRRPLRRPGGAARRVAGAPCSAAMPSRSTRTRPGENLAVSTHKAFHKSIPLTPEGVAPLPRA